MVRTYVRKTNRALIDERAVATAVTEVIKGGSVRKTAEKHGLKKSMLHKRVKMAKKNRTGPPTIANADDSGQSEDEETYVTTANPGGNKYQIRQVFSVAEENSLVNLIKASDLHYGLTYKQSRELAFQYAAALQKTNYPNIWNVNKMAGEDWILGFMKRHSELSCRRPENTSLARDAAFNATNVGQFFDNYVQILDKYKFTPDRIINLDETGIPTVMQHPKIIAPKGKKQVGTVASRERGENVTLCAIISASGVAVPPVFIFPRVHMKDKFTDGAPIGSLGLAHKSGYMTRELFLKVLQHIKEQLACSTDRRLLILMDNHSSHVSIEAINFARAAGMSLLSFPPHCSHRMQPLDVAMFGPFKGYIKVAMSDWMRTHPGRLITIDDIAALCGKAYLSAFTAKNMLSGFRTPGLWPLDRLALSEDMFQPSEVTDQPPPSVLKTIDQPSSSTVRQLPNGLIEQQPDRSSSQKSTKEYVDQTTATLPDPTLFARQQQQQQQVTQTSVMTSEERNAAEATKRTIAPEDCRPLPKAQRTKNLRKQRKSTIYTSTPVKEELEAQDKAKAESIKLQAAKAAKKVLFCRQKKRAKIEISDSESDTDIVLESEDEGLVEDEDEVSINTIGQLTDDEEVSVGSFILVRFATKKTFKYYIGRVEEVFQRNEFTVDFLRKKGDKFQFPDVPDKSQVDRKDIVSILSPPIASVTKRQGRIFHFDINFDGFNVC